MIGVLDSEPAQVFYARLFGWEFPLTGDGDQVWIKTPPPRMASRAKTPAGYPVPKDALTEADHGRSKSRLRPMRGLTARLRPPGDQRRHAFVQKLREPRNGIQHRFAQRNCAHRAQPGARTRLAARVRNASTGVTGD